MVADAAALEADARLALDLARRFGDVALEGKALADGGLALVSAGRIEDGMAWLDESMAMVSAGQFDMRTPCGGARQPTGAPESSRSRNAWSGMGSGSIVETAASMSHSCWEMSRATGPWVLTSTLGSSRRMISTWAWILAGSVGRATGGWPG